MSGTGPDAPADPVPSPRRAVVLVNPGSRRGGVLAGTIGGLLEERGVVVERVRVLDHDLDEALDEALADGVPLVVVAAGDGTLSHAAGRLAHRDVVLGVVPTGTTNNFARGLGIPIRLGAALDVIAGGRAAAVDLGVVGEDRFANVVSLGIGVHVAASVSAGLKRRIGRAAYAVAGLRALARHRPLGVSLETEEGVLAYGTHQLIVANGRFHAGTLIDEGESHDDGLLVVFHLGDRRRLALLRSLVLFALRRPRTLHAGNTVRVRSLRLTTEPPADLEVDGEVRARTPVDIAVDPGAVQVLVPRDWRPFGSM